jgi:hypothetical protein
MTSDTKLGKCPWCRKGRAYVKYLHEYKSHQVECQHCWTMGPQLPTEEQAADAWNKLSQLSQMADLLAAYGEGVNDD